jgi:hypothetical protein
VASIGVPTVSEEWAQLAVYSERYAIEDRGYRTRTPRSKQNPLTPKLLGQLKK